MTLTAARAAEQAAEQTALLSRTVSTCNNLTQQEFTPTDLARPRLKLMRTRLLHTSSDCLRG
jgi:hypothetical protein